MEHIWRSANLYEHPAPHQKGKWGHIELTGAHVYVLALGSWHMTCPQDWAARIHARETQG